MKVMSLNNSFCYKMYKLTARTCLNWRKKNIRKLNREFEELSYPYPIPHTHIRHPHSDSRKQNIKENVPSINSSWWIMLIYPLFWQVCVIDLNNFADKKNPTLTETKFKTFTHLTFWIDQWSFEQTKTLSKKMNAFFHNHFMKRGIRVNYNPSLWATVYIIIHKSQYIVCMPITRILLLRLLLLLSSSQ